VVTTGKTPVLNGTDWRRLLDAIPTDTVRDLRDRALIATLTYSFARVAAARKLKMEDLRPNGTGWQIHLHEKGGKEHKMPCHHALAEMLHAYVAAADGGGRTPPPSRVAAAANQGSGRPARTFRCRSRTASHRRRSGVSQAIPENETVTAPRRRWMRSVPVPRSA
jgi:integrase